MLEIDGKIRALLSGVKTIAMVGASADATRDSHQVMAFLQDRGYRVVPVNPTVAGDSILGEMVYSDLLSVPGDIDMVDIFRNSAAAGSVVDEAIARGAKSVWMQLGVVNAPAARRAEAAGLIVIMDRCPKIEIRRLGISRRRP
jgi:predicted CoA-binding protein